ncbi:MAG: cytochrome P450, partial [Pseudomonadales bacterium]
MMLNTATDTPDHTQFEDNTDLSHIPGDLGYPLVGRLPAMLKSMTGLAQDQYERFGPVSRFAATNMRHVVMVLGPDNVQRLVMDKDREFSVQKGYEHSLTTFFGRGLLMYDFDEHRVQRRILQTSFKTAAMRSYIDVMTPIILRDIEQRWQFNDQFVFFPHIKRMLLDVASEVFFGVSSDSNETERLTQAFLDIVDGQMGLFRVELPGFKFHKGMRAKRTLEATISALIPGRRGSDGTDMLTHMCNAQKEDGSYFTDDEIIPHANFLLFAAHDTTTSALSHVMYLCGRHPEWQDKARAECQALGKDRPAYDDLDKLVVLDKVFKESLRLHPSVPIQVRRTTRAIEMGGYNIPAYTQVCTVPSFSHYMSEYWT